MEHEPEPMRGKPVSEPIYYMRKRTEEEREQLFETARRKWMGDGLCNMDDAMMYARDFENVFNETFPEREEICVTTADGVRRD